MVSLPQQTTGEMYLNSPHRLSREVCFFLYDQLSKGVVCSDRSSVASSTNLHSVNIQIYVNVGTDLQKQDLDLQTSGHLSLLPSTHR